MSYIPLEKLVHKTQLSLYRLVLASAARANELAQGAQPLIETPSKKVTTISLEEFAAHKVRYEEVAKSKKKSAAAAS